MSSTNGNNPYTLTAMVSAGNIDRVVADFAEMYPQTIKLSSKHLRGLSDRVFEGIVQAFVFYSGATMRDESKVTFMLLISDKQKLPRIIRGKSMFDLVLRETSSACEASRAPEFPDGGPVSDFFMVRLEINDDDEPVDNPCVWMWVPRLAPALMDGATDEQRNTFDRMIREHAISFPIMLDDDIEKPTHNEKATIKTLDTIGAVEEELLLANVGKCKNCKQDCLKRKRCSKCMRAVYCGKACQLGDWKSHKAVCVAKSPV